MANPRQIRPIPEVAYIPMKKKVVEYKWVHYLLHFTYCRAKFALEQREYDFYTPQEWREKYDK